MNQTIYLIRHGTTKWNKEEVFRGRADMPLNSTGRKEAVAIRKALEHIELLAVYSSPLIRAVETASPLASSRGLDVITREGLIDVNFGKWQGLRINEAKEGFPDLFENWLLRPHLVKFPGGEDLKGVRERSSGDLLGICESKQDGNIAVVSHRVVNKLIIMDILNIDNAHFWRFKVDPGSMSIITRENGRTVLQSLNVTSHLESLIDERTTKDF